MPMHSSRRDARGAAQCRMVPALVALSALAVTGAPADAPRLQSAQFTDGGSTVTLRFDGRTDRGGRRGVFACSELLTFTVGAGVGGVPQR